MTVELNLMPRRTLWIPTRHVGIQSVRRGIDSYFKAKLEEKLEEKNLNPGNPSTTVKGSAASLAEFQLGWKMTSSR